MNYNVYWINKLSETEFNEFAGSVNYLLLVQIPLETLAFNGHGSNLNWQ